MMRSVVLLVLASVAVYAQPSTMVSPVRGTREMVGAANNFQVEAGWRILMAGGNAIDAGVASVLAASVTEQSRFGLGGEMPLLVKVKGKPPVAISGIGTAPKLATIEFYATRQPESWETVGGMAPIPAQGIRAAILPGVFDGLILALREYGTKSYCEVSAPAAGYADGFPIGEEYAGFIKNLERFLRLWPDSQAFFLPGDKAPVRGEIFRSPTLAATLRNLCTVEQKTRGNRAKKLLAVRDEFYKGGIAKKIAAFSEANGGLIRYDDLAGFKAEIDTTRTTTYRGYEIVKPGFWTQGPVMLQTMNILEGYDLKGMGHNSPEYLHTVVEAVKLAFADRDRYYGDPKFSKIPEEILLSKSYAAERRKLIDPAHSSRESRPGPIAQPLQSADTGLGKSIAMDTTCVNVIDKDGNAFSATPSGAWLPSVIAGDTGIPLSTRLQSMVTTSGHPNQLAPGKRPRVTLSPTMVLKDGQPWLVMSTPGGDNQDQAMVQVLLNLIEFGMTSQEAAESPRFQTEHFYSSFANHEFTPNKLNLEARISKETAEKLRAMGHEVVVTGPWSNGSAPTLIKVSGGVLEGGADPRRLRYVFGR
jgi:gamma-glutamyltranspeptidase / glutathione hydrolase